MLHNSSGPSEAQDITMAFGGLREESESGVDYDFPHFDLSDFVSTTDHLDMYQNQALIEVQSEPPTHSHHDSVEFHKQGQSDNSGTTADTQQLTAPMHMLHVGDIPSANSGVRTSNPAPGSLHSNLMHTPDGPDTTTALLKTQLAKQIQLQRLQHMQNQLLQQQIELISGGNNGDSFDPSRVKDFTFPGLLTPSSSTEMPPTTHSNFVSPMILQQTAPTYTNSNDINNAYYSLVSQAMTSRAHAHQAMTAPASMVFHNTGLHTPGLEYFSPLTSPALGPVMYSQEFNQSHSSTESQQGALQSNKYPPTPASAANGSQGEVERRPKLKRRSSVDEPTTRKRSSPLILPMNKRTQSTRGTALSRTTRSRASTVYSPVLLSSTSPTSPLQPDQENENGRQPSQPQSTPSPVDLSMPPPAPPQSQSHLHLQTQSKSQRSSGPSSPFLAPVTPGSLMNIGHLSSHAAGLVPPDQSAGAANASDTSMDAVTTTSISSGQRDMNSATVSPISPRQTPTRRNTGRGKGSTVARAKSSSSSATSTPYLAPVGGASGSSNGNAHPHGNPSARHAASPGLKPILPGGLSVEAVTHLSLKSNYQNILEGRGLDLGLTVPPEGTTSPQVRKTSHKAAEQKRRDSLKAGFDDLRLLLPPITYDPDADSGEIIPGSNPPRGPARVLPGAEDHPNRSVSKLALLRNSNEYIVKLKRRVGRRDQALERMRLELKTLRLELNVLPEEKERNGIALMDLDEDIDAIERDGEEEKAGKLAARPTERALAAKLASETGGKPADTGT